MMPQENWFRISYLRELRCTKDQQRNQVNGTENFKSLRTKQLDPNPFNNVAILRINDEIQRRSIICECHNGRLFNTESRYLKEMGKG